MIEQGLQIPEEFIEVVTQRAHVWGEYDATQQQVTELNGLAKQLSGSGPSDTITTLSPQGTPTSEIKASIVELKEGFQAIEKESSQIAKYKEEIARIRSRAQMTYIMIGVSIIIVAFLAFNALA